MMISTSDFRSLCAQRHSIRYFDTSKSVSREEIMELLSLADLAPSVENTQPWRFHVVFEHALRQKLIESCCYGNFLTGAGVFIVVTCDRSALPVSHEIIWNPVEMDYSCVAAMEHILLGAVTAGLGACWVSLHHGKTHELLGLPKTHVIIGGIMVGRLKKAEQELSEEHQRKPLSEKVKLYE